MQVVRVRPCSCIHPGQSLSALFCCWRSILLQGSRCNARCTGPSAHLEPAPCQGALLHAYPAFAPAAVPATAAAAAPLHRRSLVRSLAATRFTSPGPTNLQEKIYQSSRAAVSTCICTRCSSCALTQMFDEGLSEVSALGAGVALPECRLQERRLEASGLPLSRQG